MIEAVALARELLRIPSVSRDERAICDFIEERLQGDGELSLARFENNLVARIPGSGPRVLLAGHLDTVPGEDRVFEDGEVLGGLGAVDMKAGVAAMCEVATRDLARDLTLVWYSCEEIDASENGLRRLAGAMPGLLDVDLAVVLEPSGGAVELGCQGTLRAKVELRGRRAHSARPWMGRNAISRAASLVDRVDRLEPRRPILGGVEFKESLSAVRIESFVANNVIPDSARIWCNYRFAPDLSPEEAAARLLDWLQPVLEEGDTVTVEDAVAGAPATMSGFEGLVAAAGSVRAKLGWTDAGFLATHGVPAVNFGPGDPLLAHSPGEVVAKAEIAGCVEALASWLAG